MGAYRGCSGMVYIEDLAASGAAARVYEVNSWEFNESVPLNDASQIGDCTKRELAGPVETTGTLSLWLDAAATSNQTDLTIGNLIKLQIYPRGPTSGSDFWTAPTGGVLLSGIGRSGSVDANNALSVDFKVQGLMAATSVP